MIDRVTTHVTEQPVIKPLPASKPCPVCGAQPNQFEYHTTSVNENGDTESVYYCTLCGRRIIVKEG